MNLTKYFLVLILSLAAGKIFADPIDRFVLSLKEQENMVFWVKDNATTNLTKNDATVIVREVYAQAYSKNISPTLLVAMIATESGFNRTARSKEGALGLMQVIPKYHQDKIRHRDPTNIKVSIDVGTQILSDCLDKHHKALNKALNCYSGGGGVTYAKRISKFQKTITSFVNNFESILVASN